MVHHRPQPAQPEKNSLNTMQITRTQKNALRSAFKIYSDIKVVYIFGSYARGDSDASSDIDFAIFIDPTKKHKAFDILLDLSSSLGLILKSDKYDVVMLNLVALFIRSGLLAWARSDHGV